MKLKRLIIQGFKSFKDRTIINFDDGITGIVGPNGCGKSNIVDALFWVMGEQSAKHLRGNSMKDLIFSGSSRFNPGAWAEASLILDNAEGKHIHIGNKVASPTEIQLTRKLYRNGETEYRINDTPCRLKDIQEVFMDTGAGAKSYSIIAQGEINRLVQAKPQERRTMIEEVAGITKFKLRKRESLKKIEQTELNLGRLSDLQVEIEKNLKALQKQAEKAERARSLKEKIKRNDLIVHSHKVFEFLKDIREIHVSLNGKNLEVEGWNTLKNKLEIDLEGERIQKEDQSEKIELLAKERNELSNKLAAAEERFNGYCQQLTEKEKLVDSRQKEVEDLELELDERQEKKKNLVDELSEVKDRGLEDFDFTEKEAQVEELKESLELKSEQVTSGQEFIAEKKDELQKIEQVIFQNNSKLEEYASALQDTTQELDALEGQFSGFSQEVSRDREAVNEVEKKLSELNEKEALQRLQVENFRNVDQALSEKLKSESKILIETSSKLSSLIEIKNSLDGVREGTSAFLSNVVGDQYRPLGELIKCDDQYTKAVQLLLSEVIDSIVTTEEDLEQFLEWRKNNSEKALDLLLMSKNSELMSEESLERLQISFPEGLTRLADVVDMEGPFYSKIKPFFDGHFIVSELDEGMAKALSLSPGVKAIASLDGQKVIRNFGNAKIFGIRGDDDNSMGVVARNNKIEELTLLKEKLEREVISLEAACAESSDKLKVSILELDEVRNSLADCRADYAGKKSGLNSKLTGFESNTTRIDILKNRRSEISKSRLVLLENEEGLEGRKLKLVSEISDNTEKLEIDREEYQLQKEFFEQEREELVSRQVEIRTFEQRLKSLDSQIEDIEAQIQKIKIKMASGNELIENYNREVEHIGDQIDSLESSNQELAELVQDKDEVLSLLKDQFSELLLNMQEREDEVKKLTKSISQNEKTMAELEAKYERFIEEEADVVRNIFEKFQIDLRDALGRFLEYAEDDYLALVDISSVFVVETENGPKKIAKESFEFVRRYGQDLKDCVTKLKDYKTEFARLGEINWQAIEDYERQKLRNDFLKVQEQELRKSLEDLQIAIGHIDEKSRERFKLAYEEVNSRFEKVFPIIFGGGSATLQVTGHLDDPECGVDIIASPPGKKMQNINLMSGGEKALTAVSLIFSIFLVKPSPFCLLDEVDAPLDDANVGRFNELLREMSSESQFILITHNKKTMELNDTLYGVTMQEPGVSTAVSVQLH